MSKAESRAWTPPVGRKPCMRMDNTAEIEPQNTSSGAGEPVVELLRECKTALVLPAAILAYLTPTNFPDR
jgi:hypothetical protein